MKKSKPLAFRVGPKNDFEGVKLGLCSSFTIPWIFFRIGKRGR